MAQLQSSLMGEDFFAPCPATVTRVVAPSGEQYEISGSGYRAVVTECGAGLRLLEHDGRPLVDGYDESGMASGGRGQLLVPWPNRIRDGQYAVGDRQLQLPLTEPGRHNASHGLVRWVAWSLEEHTGRSVALRYRLMAQSGYPWTLDLHVVYDLSADGLTVMQSATNLAADPAPYAQGAHPYLTVGPGPCDGWELTLPAATRSLVRPGPEAPHRPGAGGRDGVRLPGGPAAAPDRARPRLHRPGAGPGRPGDRRAPRPGVRPRGRPVGGRGAPVADGLHGRRRDRRPPTCVAVEPMTAQADAFRSGEDLLMLAPAPGVLRHLGHPRPRLTPNDISPIADPSLLPVSNDATRASRERRD